MVSLGIIAELILPRFSGNPTFSVKYQYYMQNKGKFNTLLLGSSRTYRQLDPAIINPELNRFDVNAFNFGAPSLFNPEVFRLYEDLLKNIEDGDVKYVVLELQQTKQISTQNIFTYQSYYWLKFSDFLYSIKYFLNSQKTVKNKIKIIKNYVLSYIQKSFRFGALSELLHFRPLPAERLGSQANGFFSLDAQYLGEATDRRTKIQRNPEEFLLRETVARRATLDGDLNPVLARKLDHLLKISSEKNIDLYFLIVPREGDYEEIYAMAKYLPENKIINMSDPDQYPEFYSEEYSFDIGHLNEIGARILSKKFAEILDKKL